MKEKMGGFKTNPPKPSQNSPTAIATTDAALVPDWCRHWCRTVAPAAKVNNRCGEIYNGFHKRGKTFD